jgi:hypothetical protein
MTAPTRRSRATALQATLVMACALALAACGDDDDSDGGTTAVTEVTEVEVTEVTEVDVTEVATTDVEVTEADHTDITAGTKGAVTEPSEPDATVAPEGVLFEAPEGDYSIVFSAAPTDVAQDVPLPDGTTLPIVLHIVETPDVAEGSARSEYPAGSTPSLEGARDGALASFPGATLTSSEAVSQQGRDGLEFVLDLASTGTASTYISRLFLDGGILYQVIYVGADVAVTDPEVVTFFDSFQFTEDR